MRRKLNIVAIAILIILLLPFNTVFAANGSLNSIENKAFVNSDGTVNIEQIWEYDDRQVDGTEHFVDLKVLYSNNGSIGNDETITDYKVYLDDQLLEFKDNWNVGDSFEEKAGKYGIVEKGGSVELCFGITNYEINSFRIEYTVHNAIKETTDGAKYLHWTFTPDELNPNPQNLNATIETNDNITIDKVYGFNYEGQVNFDDMEKKDKITATMNEGSYSTNTVLNIFTLLKDDNNLITNTRLTGETLENKITQIFEGSDYDISDFHGETQKETNSIIKENSGEPLTIIQIIMSFFNLGFAILTFAIMSLTGPIIFVIIGFSIFKMIKIQTAILSDIPSEQRKLWSTKDFYRREEPEEITDFFPILELVTSTPNIRQNILLYFISKWTSEEVFQYINSSEEKTGLLTKKTVNMTFKLDENKLDINASDLERKLFSKFAKLTHSDILNTKDLDKLKISELESIFAKYKSSYKANLKEKGYVIGDNKEARLNETGVEIVNQHVGLKNYLRDFTLIHEREASEIKLWDYYFHMAAFYGLTDVFKKQLDKLPNLDMNDKQTYNKYYGSTGTGALNKNISKKMASNYSSYTSRSSGGGGSSSRGGGGGSSGGGSRGGTR